ncbi:hypothetical protein BC834DRAFT_889666 [Gloeopeniophorella convolvens]|nr:hypothetical protein BC834DRAFT_889666 [Gloeopeniophorella convolvens]
MNRLTPILYIRSTLSSSRAELSTPKEPGIPGQPSESSVDNARVGGDKTLEKSQSPAGPAVSNTSSSQGRPAGSLKKASSRSTSTSGATVGETLPRPNVMHRESSFLLASRNIGNPFQNAEPSGSTPTHVEDNPFERAVMENIVVGTVPVHTPRLTDPIAPCIGFAMQAEIVKKTSKFSEFRKAQRGVSNGRQKKVDVPGGTPFFASRERDRSQEIHRAGALFNASPKLLDSTDTESLFDTRRPLVDYLKVDIPRIGISLIGENDL